MYEGDVCLKLLLFTMSPVEFNIYIEKHFGVL